jgi:hypothetical protein
MLIPRRNTFFLHRLLREDFDAGGIVANRRGKPDGKMEVGKRDLMHIANAIARSNVVVTADGNVLRAARRQVARRDGRRATGEDRFLVLVEDFHAHVDRSDRARGNVLDLEGDHRLTAFPLLDPVGLEIGELPSPGARYFGLRPGRTCRCQREHGEYEIPHRSLPRKAKLAQGDDCRGGKKLEGLTTTTRASRDAQEALPALRKAAGQGAQA